MKIPAILINYNYEPEWLRDYPELEVILFDRSDDGIERNLSQYGAVYKTENMGDVDYDKLGWLVGMYDNLPEVFLWGKSNLLKYVDRLLLDDALEKREFKPLLRLDHKTYSDKFGVVCYYTGGMYHERADSWIFNAGLDNRGRFQGWGDWCRHFNIPQTAYIPFPPGGNFLLTREKVHKYGKALYEEMRDTLPYAMHPVEAHCAERSYYLLWK